MSKPDIDVLVRLAVRGPNEAADRRPVRTDADELGSELWAANLVATRFEDTGSVDDVFAPVPVGVTAVEGSARSPSTAPAARLTHGPSLTGTWSG